MMSMAEHIAEEKKNLLRKKRKRSLRTFLIGAAGIALIISGIYVGQKESEQAYDQYLARARQEDSEQAAVKNLKKAQAILHDKSTAFTSEARLYNSHGEYNKTIEMIQRQENNKSFSVKKNPQMFNELAFAYFLRGEYDLALPLFEELKDVESSIQLEASIGYAAVLARTGETQKSQDEIRSFSNDLEDDQKLYLQAEISASEKNYVNAEKDFNSLLQATDPDLRKTSVFALAYIYRNDNQKTITDGFTKEITVLNNAMESEDLDQSSQLYKELGQAYYARALSANRHNDLYYALDSFRKVINLKDDQEDVYMGLYDTEMQLKATDSAIKVLEEYESAFPRDYVPSMLRAQLLKQQEDEKDEKDRNYSKARKAYDSALKKYRNSLNSITEATATPSASPTPSQDPEKEFLDKMPEQLKSLYDFFNSDEMKQEDAQ